jgi:histidyl-tRNA synthetase
MKGYLNYLELTDKSAEIMVIIDKFHKIGLENTKQLLLDLDLTVDNVEKIIKLISLNGAADDIVKSLSEFNINEPVFVEGLLELREVTNCIKNFGVPDKNFEIDLTIIRGLDYYTGTVYETFLNDYKDIGSVCSGGRYEDLAGLYTQQKLPGVGVSIGLSRLFYQLTEAKFLKPETSTTTQVLIIPFDYNLEYVIKVANLLRENNINTEIYYEDKKLKQKLNYANSHGIPYVIIIGEDEIKNSTVTLKNMNLGTQEVISFLDVPLCIASQSNV